MRFDPITQMGKIDIQINKNIELSKQRNKLYESLPKKEKPKYSNILFLYIDAISRPEFIRSMKETQKFISKYYNSTKYSFYQMLKYQNFIFFTQQNVNPMFFGESMFNSNGSSILIAKGLTAAGATVLKHNVASFVEKAGGKLNGTLYIVR